MQVKRIKLAELSLILTLDVECPNCIGTPEVAVPIVIPLDVFELSIFSVDVESSDMFEPSTTSVPSTSVLSKLDVPSTARSPVTLKLSLTVVSDVV